MNATPQTYAGEPIAEGAPKVPFVIPNGAWKLKALARKWPGFLRPALGQYLAGKVRLLSDLTISVLAEPSLEVAHSDREHLMLVADVATEIAAAALGEVEKLDQARLAAERERLRREAAAAGGQGGGS